jgi:pimeloyl-ACP methyl ester carboxylesterase
LAPIVVRKRYVDLAHGQVHYRVGGKGPPVVLLHDSPRSSVMHLPQFQWLGQRFTVYALDTPGYGNSTPLPAEPAATIPDFGAALGEALHALGIGPCPVYGFHTSSKIALDLATRADTPLCAAILDGLSLPPGPPDEDFIRRYMKPFAVAADGSHLAAQWSKVLDFHRFFPWFAHSAATRLGMALPDDGHLHTYCMDTLMAGAAWSSAYAAAMRYPARAAIGQLRVPVTFACRSDDVLYRYLDELPDPLPAGCEVLRIGADQAGWRERIGERLADSADPALERGQARQRGPSPAGPGHDYLDHARGQLHVHRHGQGMVVPLVMLHDLPGSAAALQPLAEALAGHRPVLRVDLPGCGESDALANAPVSAYADALLEGLARAEFGDVDLYAEHLAAPIALELARRAGSRVRRLVLDGLPPLSAAQRAVISACYCPALLPRRDGTHLLAAWHLLRDREFSWPWFERSSDSVRRRAPALEPAQLHALTVDVLKQPAHYAEAAQAALGAPFERWLADIPQPVLLLGDAADVRDRELSAATDLFRNGHLAQRPATALECARTLRGFLD